MRHIATAIALLALAACGQPATNSTSPADAAGTNDAAAGDYIARVKALPDGQLRGVLFRAIIDGGETCQGITRIAREPDREGKPVWSAECSEGSRWVIAIGNDGVAQVTGASVRP